MTRSSTWRTTLFVGAASALLRSPDAATGPPDATRVDCHIECVPENGDCRRFDYCQHCRVCYPDEVPLSLVSSGGRLHISWEHGEEFFIKGVNWSGSDAELSVPEGLQARRTPPSPVFTHPAPLSSPPLPSPPPSHPPTIPQPHLHLHFRAHLHTLAPTTSLPPSRPPQHRSMDEILDFAADNGFNAIRIMINHQCVLHDCDLNPDGFDSLKNPELKQKR